jgi:hypothetical protein
MTAPQVAGEACRCRCGSFVLLCMSGSSECEFDTAVACFSLRASFSHRNLRECRLMLCCTRQRRPFDGDPHVRTCDRQLRSTPPHTRPVVSRKTAVHRSAVWRGTMGCWCNSKAPPDLCCRMYTKQHEQKLLPLTATSELLKPQCNVQGVTGTHHTLSTPERPHCPPE